MNLRNNRNKSGMVIMYILIMWLPFQLYICLFEDLNSSSSTLPSSTESEKSNESLPLNKSISPQKVVENIQNNPPDTTDTDTDSKSLTS